MCYMLWFQKKPQHITHYMLRFSWNRSIYPLFKKRKNFASLCYYMLLYVYPNTKKPACSSCSTYCFIAFKSSSSSSLSINPQNSAIVFPLLSMILLLLPPLSRHCLLLVLHCLLSVVLLLKPTNIST